jgi:hypothetical protein
VKTVKCQTNTDEIYIMFINFRHVAISALTLVFSVIFNIPQVEARISPGMTAEPVLYQAWGGLGYEVRVLPNPTYSYKLYVVGQNRWGSGWACRELAMQGGEGFTIDKASAEFGISKSNPYFGGNVSGSRIVGNYQKTTYFRSALGDGPYKTLHFRVVGVRNGVTAATSNWLPSNPNGLVDLDKIKGCEYMKY